MGIDLVDDSAISLDEQLQLTKAFLTEKMEGLRGLTDSQVALLIGWTPHSPQDGIAFDPDLTGVLVKARCHVRLDTYLD